MRCAGDKLARAAAAFVLLSLPSAAWAQIPAVPDVPVESAGETAAPDPLASLDPAERPIAAKMRDLLASTATRIFTDQKQRTAAETFYRNRNFAPLWLDKGVEGKRVKPVAARLRSADTDGLDPSDYTIPNFAGGSPDALAEAELKLSATVIAYARHLQGGRFSYQRVSGKNIDLPQVMPDADEVLTKIADAKDIDQALDQFRPPQPQYRALRTMLAQLRAKKVTPVQATPDRQPGKGRKTTADGAGEARLDAASHDKQIDIVIANMERWRWMPRDLGKTHVIVNLPDYTLKLMKDNSAVWTTRIVVGKPAMQTPLTSAAMKSITVNPTWNVPPSIINNEYLPALQRDPYALARIGLRMGRNRDGSLHIYQPPGEKNALGRLRFNFPNRFLVYQHDTPQKNLFALDARAYSHGCMRVQDPSRYAELLLAIARPNEGYTAERIARMYDKGESDIQLPTAIPVHLTYQTATAEDDKLVLRKDIYDYDAKVIAALKGEGGSSRVAQQGKPEKTTLRRAEMRSPYRRWSYEPYYSYGPQFSTMRRFR